MTPIAAAVAPLLQRITTVQYSQVVDEAHVAGVKWRLQLMFVRQRLHGVEGFALRRAYEEEVADAEVEDRLALSVEVEEGVGCGVGVVVEARLTVSKALLCGIELGVMAEGRTV